jgi:hypothetical protein
MLDLQNYECYRINHEEFSFLFYPSLGMMNIVYWDSVEDDEIEITIYDETGFNLDYIPFKDLEILQKYLSIFKEQK